MGLQLCLGRTFFTRRNICTCSIMWIAPFRRECRPAMQASLLFRVPWNGECASTHLLRALGVLLASHRIPVCVSITVACSPRIIPHLPTSPPRAGMMRERMKKHYCPVVMLRVVRVVWKHFPINCFFRQCDWGPLGRGWMPRPRVTWSDSLPTVLRGESERIMQSAFFYWWCVFALIYFPSFLSRVVA